MIIEYMKKPKARGVRLFFRNGDQIRFPFATEATITEGVIEVMRSDEMMGTFFVADVRGFTFDDVTVHSDKHHPQLFSGPA
jgi:hypothetical protein